MPKYICFQDGLVLRVVIMHYMCWSAYLRAVFACFVTSRYFDFASRLAEFVVS